MLNYLRKAFFQLKLDVALIRTRNTYHPLMDDSPVSLSKIDTSQDFLMILFLLIFRLLLKSNTRSVQSLCTRHINLQYMSLESGIPSFSVSGLNTQEHFFSTLKGPCQIFIDILQQTQKTCTTRLLGSHTLPY